MAQAAGDLPRPPARAPGVVRPRQPRLPAQGVEGERRARPGRRGGREPSRRGPPAGRRVGAEAQAIPGRAEGLRRGDGDRWRGPEDPVSRAGGDGPGPRGAGGVAAGPHGLRGGRRAQPGHHLAHLGARARGRGEGADDGPGAEVPAGQVRDQARREAGREVGIEATVQPCHESDGPPKPLRSRARPRASRHAVLLAVVVLAIRRDVDRGRGRPSRRASPHTAAPRPDRAPRFRGSAPRQAAGAHPRRTPASELRRI